MTCMRCPGSTPLIGLQKIPQVAVEVLEHGNDAVILFAWGFQELHAVAGHGAVIAPEIVGLQKESHAPAGLVADTRVLGLVAGLGQQQSGFAATARSEPEIHPTVAWEKLRALAQGAEIASKQLWG